MECGGKAIDDERMRETTQRREKPASTSSFVRPQATAAGMGMDVGRVLCSPGADCPVSLPWYCDLVRRWDQYCVISLRPETIKADNEMGGEVLEDLDD